jgi:uncharacterized protein (TIGR02118 family)|tara:strand:+ start:345 stop:986 length:642 start_codon:yes stop_codon:yes gene_type:complete
MYKTCFLINAGEDPFRFKGRDAEDAIRAVFPEIKGYVQARALPGQESPAFSGSAELWFDDSSIGIAACVIGIGGLLAEGVEVQSCLSGMERVVVRTAEYVTADRVKGVYPFRKKPGLTLEAFQHHWWHTHGPIAALTEEALSYVQIHTRADSQETASPVYDGITEISWPDIETAGRAIGSRQMREDQGSDAPNFVDMESISLFMAKEEVIIEP